MTHEQHILDIAKNNNGYISYTTCKQNNIPTIYLSRLVKKGLLDKLEKGIYLHTDNWPDGLYMFQSKYKNAIFSGLTALELLQQTDQIAKYVNITVTRGYKINTNGETKFRINYVDKKF